MSSKLRFFFRSAYIIAHHCPFRSENNLHNALICRIISYGGKTLVFEPPLTSNGFQLEGKLGDYVARIHIYEDSFTSLADDFAKMEIVREKRREYVWYFTDESTRCGCVRPER